MKVMCTFCTVYRNTSDLLLLFFFFVELRLDAILDSAARVKLLSILQSLPTDFMNLTYKIQFIFVASFVVICSNDDTFLFRSIYSLFRLVG